MELLNDKSELINLVLFVTGISEMIIYASVYITGNWGLPCSSNYSAFNAEATLAPYQNCLKVALNPPKGRYSPKPV